MAEEDATDDEGEPVEGKQREPEVPAVPGTGSGAPAAESRNGAVAEAPAAEATDQAITRIPIAKTSEDLERLPPMHALDAEALRGRPFLHSLLLPSTDAAVPLIREILAVLW